MQTDKKSLVGKRQKAVFFGVLAALALGAAIHTITEFCRLYQANYGGSFPTTSAPPEAAFIFILPYALAALVWTAAWLAALAIIKKRG